MAIPKNMEDFRLLSYHHRSKSIQFELAHQTSRAAVSVIIGPNGSGKSSIIADLVNEFSLLHDLIRQSTATDLSSKILKNDMLANSEVKFVLDGALVNIERNREVLRATVNNEVVEPNLLPFPKKALAVAHLPVDKFLFNRKGDSSFYSYLGLRQATNLTTTGALEKKLISSIFSGYARQHFEAQLMQWFMLLSPDLPMSYDHIRFSVREEYLHAADFGTFLNTSFEMMQKRVGSGRMLSQDKFNKMNGQDLDNCWILIQHLKRFAQIDSRITRADLLLPINNFTLALGAEGNALPLAIESARKIRVFESTALVLRKAGNLVDFTTLSSGEQQILGTMTRLLSQLEPHSLVAIDEPEVSLHPSWQMRYIPTLIKTLDQWPSTHVLLATHSHFLVADVDPAMASLNVSSAENSSFSFESFDGDVYGRSPENILYRVFGVGATGNFYIEQDLANGLAMLSGTAKTDKEKLAAIVKRLKRATGTDTEALNLIVVELENYLQADI